MKAFSSEFFRTIYEGQTGGEKIDSRVQPKYICKECHEVGEACVVITSPGAELPDVCPYQLKIFKWKEFPEEQS